MIMSIGQAELVLTDGHLYHVCEDLQVGNTTQTEVAKIQTKDAKKPRV